MSYYQNSSPGRIKKMVFCRWRKPSRYEWLLNLSDLIKGVTLLWSQQCLTFSKGVRLRQVVLSIDIQMSWEMMKNYFFLQFSSNYGTVNSRCTKLFGMGFRGVINSVLGLRHVHEIPHWIMQRRRYRKSAHCTRCPFQQERTYCGCPRHLEISNGTSCTLSNRQL